MLIAHYARCSTRYQVPGQGQSIETQLEALRAWSAREGHQVVGEFVDLALTGTTLEGRQGLANAITCCRRTKAVLATTAVSRLGRNTGEVLEVTDALHRAGSAFLSLGEGGLMSNSSSGKLLLTILSGAATWEAEVCHERVMATLGMMRRQGRRISGHPPYGWTFDPTDHHLVEVPAEQEVLRRMEHMRAEGLSFAKIADALNRDAVPAKQGGTWSGRTIRLILGRLAKLTDAA